MAESGDEQSILKQRAGLALIGAGAGAALWFLSDRLYEIIAQPRLWLFLVTLAGGYVGSLMALTGPLPMRRAAPAAFATAVPAAGLLTWASVRYDTLEAFFAGPETPVAALIVLMVPLPFVIALLRTGTAWRDYPTLFIESWGIVVRLAASAVFAGVVWLAVFLSDELLQLVEIDVVERLMRVDWLPATFTGLVTGLALAIVNEMEDFVSPSLILRLLRLMVPPALLVVGIFTAAIPFRGLDELLGILSPAGTLLTICLGLTVLITATLDADDEAAVQSTLMRWAVRALAVLLPALAVLALEAIRVRYAEDGLSPSRLAAGLAGLVLLAYGLLYSLAVLSGSRWMAWTRAANIGMALVVTVLAALWLSPVLNAERLSAADQVARFESGVTPVDQLDLWTLRHDWGIAGRDAVNRIEANAASHPQEDLLRERLVLSAQAPDRYAFDNLPRDPVVLNARAELKATMPVHPPEAAAEFDRYVLPWYAGSVAGFLDGCRDVTPSGRPGCVLVVSDLIPDNPGNEAILFYKSFGLLRGEVIVPEPVFRRANAADVFSVPPPDFEETDRLIEELQDGQFAAEPARINAITIGDRQFTVPF